MIDPDNITSGELMIRQDAKIELSNIRFERASRAILDDVSWTLAHGEHWAVVGANGSGKTTMLQIATGYLWPNEGSVCVLGEKYGQVDLRQLRKRIGWVSSSLIPLVRPAQPARDVVLAGCFAATVLFEQPTPAQHRRANELIEQIGCTAIAHSRFGVLSLGEQQRIMIARALMAEPELLILDEACAGLDLAAREGLLATIGQLAAESERTSMVIVTHHIEEIPAGFSHAMILKAGRVLAAGPKENVLTGEMLSKAFSMTVEVEHKYGRYWPKVSGESLMQ
ncbi:MAG: ABC transporter ATP-binding protein [Planctomycetaceae bacterium]|nr:MAG: ABC transporter ATP-binding protein [Planctomycetaceae bacterium]